MSDVFIIMKFYC